ncbi:MAG: hypothetical protein Q8S73_44375, partial [Deltaproteobacteria bacterium]|nr:hypothetical protein [Deltaproteobacteria bacterium]
RAAPVAVARPQPETVAPPPTVAPPTVAPPTIAPPTAAPAIAAARPVARTRAVPRGPRRQIGANGAPIEE